MTCATRRRFQLISRRSVGSAVAFATFTAALQGCTVGPEFQRPALADTRGAWVAQADTSPLDNSPWQSLQDPILTDLIKAAVAHNLDLREAHANLREARAQRDAVAGRRLPELDAAASATQQELSANGELPVRQIPHFDRRFSLYDIGFDASWEIDLWGGTRRAVEAATRRAEAANARERDTLLQVVAEVVRTYAELRGAQASLAAARQDADAQSGVAALVHQRFVAGEASDLDDVRAESQARTTAAAVAGVDATVHTAANALALLTGRPPESLASLAANAAQVPLPPASVAVGLRSDVLRRRPDIRAAEAELAAATSDVGVETANLFPSVSLVGSLGQQAERAGDLGKSGSAYYNIGPSLRWPIFAGGSIRARIRAADARAEADAARYEKTVLGALADSETAINRYAAARASLDDREAARERAVRALELAQNRYHVGDDDRLAVLEAQSLYAVAEKARAAAAQESLEDYAAMIKALGGGWDPEAPSAIAAR